MNEIHKVTVSGHGIQIDNVPTMDSPNAVSSNGVAAKFDQVYNGDNTANGAWTFSKLKLKSVTNPHYLPEEGEAVYCYSWGYASTVAFRARDASLSVTQDHGQSFRKLSFDVTDPYFLSNSQGLIEEDKSEGTNYDRVTFGRSTQKLRLRGTAATLQIGSKTLVLDESKLQKLIDLLEA